MPSLRPDEARHGRARARWSSSARSRGSTGRRGSSRARRARRAEPLVVVTGASLGDRDDSLATLARSFLIGGPIAVLLASGIGYLLATIGFRPVEAMRQRAKRISLTREGERLPLPDAHDEIRRLGETLNEMLARLEESFERERQFVADASHELRTPLAVVKAELEAAMRAEGNGAQRARVAGRRPRGDRPPRTARGGPAPDRPLGGRRAARTPRGGGAARTARAHRPALRATAPASRAAGSTSTRRRTCGVAIDPLRSRQALGNLVDNALRYGAGDIRLAARGNGDVGRDRRERRGRRLPRRAGAACVRALRARRQRPHARGDRDRARDRARDRRGPWRHGRDRRRPASNGATVRLRVPLGARAAS